jgi:hypothetical protein
MKYFYNHGGRISYCKQCSVALLAQTISVVKTTINKGKNFMHSIQYADSQMHGKAIESTQPFANTVKHFQSLGEIVCEGYPNIGYVHVVLHKDQVIHKALKTLVSKDSVCSDSNSINTRKWFYK